MKKKRQFTVIIEEGEDGYLIGTALELKGCHTQGKTIEQLLFQFTKEKMLIESINSFCTSEKRGE